MITHRERERERERLTFFIEMIPLLTSREIYNTVNARAVHKDAGLFNTVY